MLATWRRAARTPEPALAPRSVLVAIGDGPASTRALEHAVALAERSGSRLTIMHVLCPSVPTSSGGYLAAVPCCEEHGAMLLERAEGAVGERVPLHTVLRRGRVVEELLRRVEAAEHDVVVIGRRRRLLSRCLVSADVCRASLARSGARIVVVD